MQDLEGKVAFVTGGASGMGLAMVRSFLGAGMKVVAADVEQAALDRLKTEFAGNNALLTMQVDVTDRAAMARAADATEQAFGKVHVLCNNAGVVVAGRVDSMSYRDWDWVLGVNLDGVVNGLQTFLPRIEKHGEGGHIVNTASMAGQIPVPGLSVYNASKYAVVGISETIRLELAPLGIGVSVLCPGVVATNIFDSGRNRPSDLVNEDGKDTAKLSLGPEGARNDAEAASTVARGLDPALVGEMVVDAIRKDDAYVFTHPELQSAVDTRQAALRASFDRWAEFRS